MTDETREMLNEEEQAMLEETDAEMEDAAAEELSEAVEEAAEPAVESTDEEPQLVQVETEPTDEDEEDFDEAEGPVEENPTVETAMDVLLDDEQEPDQEVDESPEEAAEIDGEVEEPAEEGQAAKQTEETPAEPPAQEDAGTPTVESVIEAILFATDEPLTENRLASIVETTAKQVRASIKALNAKYEGNGSAFRIEQIAGGHQMLTLSLYNMWLKKMLRARSDTKLSPAAMETLAIIAYKQPIIRVDIEAIRGVAVGEVIRSLMYKGLVKITGRAEVLGRPMLYGTTKKFLEVFGLNSIKDLPKAEELKNPDRG